jgi:hypothetical protein
VCSAKIPTVGHVSTLHLFALRDEFDFLWSAEKALEAALFRLFLGHAPGKIKVCRLLVFCALLPPLFLLFTCLRVAYCSYVMPTHQSVERMPVRFPHSFCVFPLSPLCTHTTHTTITTSRVSLLHAAYCTVAGKGALSAGVQAAVGAEGRSHCDGEWQLLSQGRPATKVRPSKTFRRGRCVRCTGGTRRDPHLPADL